MWASSIPMASISSTRALPNVSCSGLLGKLWLELSDAAGYFVYFSNLSYALILVLLNQGQCHNQLIPVIRFEFSPKTQLLVENLQVRMLGHETQLHRPITVLSLYPCQP